MSELSGLLSEDARKPIQRLRRSQLWRVADAYGIAYPKDAAATVMVSVLEGAGIDVTRPLPEGEQVMQMIQVKKEDGSVAMEAAPVVKLHATSSKNIDYDAEIEKRIAENTTLQTENTAMADSLAAITARLDALAAENAELKAEKAKQDATSKPAPQAKTKAAAAKPKAKVNGEDLT